MHRPRRASNAFLALMIFTLAGLVAGCSASSGEQQLLERYFGASRMRDNSTLANIATVSFRPSEEGVVQDFSVTNVGPEQVRTLRIRELGEAYENARAEETEFVKQRKEYQDTNIEAIDRVLTAERENGRVARRDQDVQETWTKMREEMTQYAGGVSQARDALDAERGIAELSVFSAANPIDVTQYDGQLTTKEVTISAQVDPPAGETVTRNMVVIMNRAELTDAEGAARNGRWVITSIQEAGATAPAP